MPFALNMGVVVVPVAGLREHCEQGECEEEHLGSHVCFSLQELVLLETGVFPLLFRLCFGWTGEIGRAHV